MSNMQPWEHQGRNNSARGGSSGHGVQGTVVERGTLTA